MVEDVPTEDAPEGRCDRRRYLDPGTPGRSGPYRLHGFLGRSRDTRLIGGLSCGSSCTQSKLI
ncbi:unnamed protein product [Arabis nemorensis]|uniref:Uncharacterized protein n=1 Tax=Arabis nemorensis TaxID=586526 RepID=A0A565BC76_9BRAS|nr:unnamed protein product [Arabis nemorensis]